MTRTFEAFQNSGLHGAQAFYWSGRQDCFSVFLREHDETRYSLTTVSPGGCPTTLGDEETDSFLTTTIGLGRLGTAF